MEEKYDESCEQERKAVEENIHWIEKQIKSGRSATKIASILDLPKWRIQKTAKNLGFRKKRRWYFYVLICPITNEIRYVGSTRSPRNRLYHHIAGACSKRMAKWINWLKKDGNAPIMKLICYKMTSEPNRYEIFLMREFHLLGCDLLNDPASTAFS